MTPATTDRRDAAWPARAHRQGDRPLVLLLVAAPLWAGAANALGAAGLRIGAVGAWAPAYPGLAATPVALAGAGVVAVLAIAARRRWCAAVAVLATVVLAVAVVPRALPGGGVPATGPALTVASANLTFGGADPAAVVDLVRRRDVDVLSLQELTPQAAAALDAAGLAELLPYRHYLPDDRAAGSGLASRFPLQARPHDQQSYHFQPVAGVAVPGAGEVEVVAVHTVAQVGRVTGAEWAAELAALPAAGDGGPTRLLVGDFNATLDHRPMRDVLDRGYLDAADATGRGLRGTWSPHPRLPALVAIDHVLVPRSGAVRSFDVEVLPGGDHRAVVARLVLPAPG